MLLFQTARAHATLIAANTLPPKLKLADKIFDSGPGKGHGLVALPGNCRLKLRRLLLEKCAVLLRESKLLFGVSLVLLTPQVTQVFVAGRFCLLFDGGPFVFGLSHEISVDTRDGDGVGDG